MHEEMTVKEVAAEIDNFIATGFRPPTIADARLLGMLLFHSNRTELLRTVTDALRDADGLALLSACSELINVESRYRMVKTAIQNRNDRWNEVYIEKINRELRGEPVKW